MSKTTTMVPKVQLNLLFRLFFSSSLDARVFLSAPEVMASCRFFLSLEALIGFHPFHVYWCG